MSKIYTDNDGGEATNTRGLKVINSYNLSPTTIVAVPAPGTQMTTAQINSFEIFTAAQTGAGTDVILLPTTAPIGTLVVFVAASVCRIKAGLDGSGLTINAAADTLSVPLVVGARTEFRKQSATNWACMHVVAAGTITAPTPA